MKIIISGGGSGGHVFPAIAIADALKKRNEFIDILFIGAIGKIEMEKVPKAGYEIKGLWISGFHRKRMWRNLSFPFKLTSSLMKAFRIIKKFKPDVVVGVGGYASGPTLEVAIRLGIPTLIQEQNSFAGITNRLVGKRVNTICTAYENMERFFPKERTVLTGNPIRQDLFDLSNKRDEAIKHFDLDPNKKVLFVFGGSLGAKTLNEMMHQSFEKIKSFKDIEVLWQVGKLYEESYKNTPTALLDHVKCMAFVDRMDLAYAVADVVLCRGGGTISELKVIGQPAILIPSPNVAENHQYFNVKALEEENAAILVAEKDAISSGIDDAVKLLNDVSRQKELSKNIQALAKPNASEEIVDEIMKLIEKND